MIIKYNKVGAERKILATAVAQELETTAKYLGMPSAAYHIGNYKLDKDGVLSGNDNRSLVSDLQGLYGFVPVSEEYDVSEAELYAEREMRRMNQENQNILDNSNRGQYGGDDDIPEDWENGMTEEDELGLGRSRRESFQRENGMSADDVPEYFSYRAELSDPEWPDRMEIITASSDIDAIRQAWEFCTGDVILLELFLLNDDYDVVRGVEITPARLSITYPLKGFTKEKLNNLQKLVAAKAPLLKAALGADDLQIQQNDDTISFPWFKFTDDAATVKAYSALVSLLCRAAVKKTRVTVKEKDASGSPKYAMRCFLLSLGFIGADYKAERKILLSKLSGNSAYKNSASGD